MTAIFIDADACPVREEVYRVAGRLGVKVWIVHNGSRPIRPPALAQAELVIVGSGFDAADDWIAEHISPGDVCVTGDIPLAARCLKSGSRALSPQGHPWTHDNIGAALAGRELSRHLREIGQGGGGPSGLTKADRSHFLSSLDTMLAAIRKEVHLRGSDNH